MSLHLSSVPSKTVPWRGQRRSLRRAPAGAQRCETLLSPTSTALYRLLNSRRGQKDRRFRLARSAARPACRIRSPILLARRGAA